MPPYEQGRGVTPAEQRGAHTVTDSTATPPTRRGGHAATTGIKSTSRRASIPSGDRLYEEACAGNPPAGFCEGETHNGAWSNTVTLRHQKAGATGNTKQTYTSEEFSLLDPNTLDQAHHAIDRKLLMMKGFHHPHGANGLF